MIFQPPFPQPIEPLEAEVPLIFIHIFILVMFIVLMLYTYKNIKEFMIIVIVYGFSLITGFEYMIHGHPPFSPMIEIFFVFFQSGIFLLSSLEYVKEYKNKKYK